MPRLIKLTPKGAAWSDDRFTQVAEDQPVPAGDVIISLSRFLAEGEALQAQGRDVGVRIEAHEAVEDLAYDLPRIPVIAAVFPKFRDGRPYSAATLLRERYHFTGEIRAVGDVLREQAKFMVRCGFDAFEPADGSTPEQWDEGIHRFRHVYQRAADDQVPASEPRARDAGAPQRAKGDTHAV